MAAPAIRLEFLTTDYDRQAMLAGIAITRKITSQPALKPYIAGEVDPGANVTCDEDKIKDLRNRGASSLHPVGTCSMGHGPTAVVDARLRVHGIGGLRVVDASIMPSIVAGNTNAPSIMIGEKGAQMILEDAAG